MPIISRVGNRSIKVRAVYAAVYALLIVGAVSMVYPFLLMLVGSVKSEADFNETQSYPHYWFDDAALFRKYAESKHNVDISVVERYWGRRVGSWSAIEPILPQDPKVLEAYLEWREQCPWWELGHTGGGKLLPINARLFRDMLYEQFDGDILAMQQALDVPYKSWSSVIPPPLNPFRYQQRDARPFDAAFYRFAQTRPIQDRLIFNPDGEFRYQFLVYQYGSIEDYNRQHGTSYTAYEEIFLTRQPPAQEGLIRDDWERFVRNQLRLDCIRLLPQAEEAYRAYLAQRYNGDIASLNAKHSTDYASFEEIPLPQRAPKPILAQVDWEGFIKDAQVCKLEWIEVDGPRQAFEAFLAQRLGVPVEEVIPTGLPIAEADYHDTVAHASELRWEFTTRNYKQVLDYILLHGNGIANTLIYCGLAVGTALMVNPLAAYALSRYRPRSTYTVLLFCMATTAFPGEVTMIPAFLLLKRFPLWPLAGGVAAFLVGIALFNRLLSRWPEMIRLTLAVALGVLVGAWAVPMMTDKPYVSLLNTFAALVLPTMANGFSIFLLKGFFDSLPRELYEAADIDGAGEWTKFWTLTMNLSKPILAVIGLQAFIAAYSAFMMALIIIPDQDMWTLMVWLFQLQSEAHPAVMYASLVIAAIPTFLVFTFCQNLIMRGIVVPVEK
ncbi:MAG TPA: ABC transporter permease subunit [Phycisphaeraceae bacterium]